MRFRLLSSLLAFLLLAAQGSSNPGAPVEKAPELRKSIWINSLPLTLKALKGKVVVLDFWAFDCPPCVEAMPHIVELERKYAGKDLVFIGVHTPRTSAERDISNVRKAVVRMGIRYPVVVDNDHRIFEDYRCDLWPTQFVIDGNGTIRYVHGGVGRYAELEATVQRLLKENAG